MPSFLLLLGVLPFWNKLRALSPIQAALRGVNAAVVGILLAALYNPVWTSAIFTAPDFALALGAFLVLAEVAHVAGRHPHRSCGSRCQRFCMM